MPAALRYPGLPASGRSRSGVSRIVNPRRSGADHWTIVSPVRFSAIAEQSDFARRGGRAGWFVAGVVVPVAWCGGSTIESMTTFRRRSIGRADGAGGTGLPVFTIDPTTLERHRFNPLPGPRSCTVAFIRRGVPLPRTLSGPSRPGRASGPSLCSSGGAHGVRADGPSQVYSRVQVDRRFRRSGPTCRSCRFIRPD